MGNQAKMQVHYAWKRLVTRFRAGRRRTLATLAVVALVASTVVIGAPAASAATNPSVQFDGSNDYITFGDPAELDLSQFTVETWFKRTGTGVATTTSGSGGGGFANATNDGIIPLVAKGRGEADGDNRDMNYILGITNGTNGTHLGADFEEGPGGSGPLGLNHRIIGSTTIANDVWYHAAVTYDGSVFNLYLNGALDATLAVNQPTRSDSIQHASLGTAMNSSGSPSGYFAGTIDEARIWNLARTPAEIIATRDAELSSNPGGLIARWGLNEDSGTTAADSIAPSSNGTLTNGPTWVEGFPPSSANPPDAPVLVAPADAATGVSTSPTLDVTVSDPDGGLVDVSFFGRPLASGQFSLIGTQSGVASGTSATMTWPAIGAGQTFEWYASITDGGNTTQGDTWTFHTDLGTDTVFVGTGDIASCSVTGDDETAAIMAGLDGPIFTTGDNVYPNGTAQEFNDCFDPVWGTFTPRIRPVPGNHDWGTGATNNLDGYFGYFGANANAPGPSYYSYDIDADWHVVNLDSECQQAALGGCGAGSPQEQWLIADLAANASKNVIAIWHKPRFGSGSTNYTAMQPLVDVMYEAGVDITLAGHDHIYERLAPIDASGAADPSYGMRHFTVGTGGEAHHGAGAPIATSEALDDSTFGIMKFTLRPTSYDWQYLPVAGATFTDSGTASVHPAPPGPGETAIDLGDSGGYVTFGDPAELDLVNFSIETWFKRTGPGVSGTTGTGGVTTMIPLVTHGAPEADNSNVDANWILGINDVGDVLAADFEDNVSGGNHPISGTTPIANDVWHHAATTYDGTTLKLYLDGNLEASQVVALAARSDTIQHAGLGVMLRSNGAPANTARFEGVLDESRVWDRALDRPELAANINAELTTGAGLVARWGMDEGTGTTIGDSTSPASNGTTTGSGTSWVPGAPFDLIIDSGPPDAPVLVAPADASTGVSNSPTLAVAVSDPDGDDVTTTFYGREAQAAAGEDFTIVVVPDTQHYVDNAGRAPTFTEQTQWIVDNEDDLNIAFVSHLGDITEEFDTVEVEWQRADASMSVLDNAGIPNNVSPGNHDLGTGATTSTFFDQYFPPARYDLPQNPWYGGWLGEEPGQINRENKDNYELFTAGGIDFLIIHLEIDIPTYAVDWANDIISRYPNRQVILSTHAFLNTSGSRPTGTITGRPDGLSAAAVWTQLINDNCNVFLVVNGHYPGEGRTTSTNSCGQPVHQVVTDYQSRANGGDGWLRYYTFRPSTNEIDAFTYSSKLSAFETDANSQFTLNYNMADVGGFVEIGDVTTASGSTASVPWSGLDPDTEYEWYAVSDDGTTTTTSSTWSFTTTATANWTSYIDLRSSPGDSNATNVLEIPAQPAVAAYDSGPLGLDDITSGSAVGATATVVMNEIDTTSDNPPSPSGEFTGGPARDLFTGIVDPQGVYSFNEATDQFDITLGGLDPSKEYEVAASINRAQAANPERWADLSITGADSSVEASGGTTTVVNPTQVRFEAQDNTARGDMARWIAIDPGADGSITIVANSFEPAGTDRTYAPSMLMVREFGGDPTFDQDLGDRADAEGTVVAGLFASATDPDDDPLTWSATGLPSGLAIDTGTGEISGTIDNGAAAGSPYSVAITVSDGAVADATDTFNWTVTSNDVDPPIVTLTSPTEGATFTPGQVVNAGYSCADAGSGIASCVGDVASGTPIDTTSPGPHTFTVVGTDNASNQTTAVVNYVVEVRPIVSSGPVGVTEGNTGSTVVNFPIKLSSPSAYPVTVDWATVDATAEGIAKSGADFLAASGTVTFAPGQTLTTVPITVLGDTIDEPDFIFGEWGFVSLSNPSANATLTTGDFFGLGVFIIVDDDPPPVISAGSAAIVEGNAGSSVVNVPVTLSNASATPVTVNWSTVDNVVGAGLAASGADFVSASGTLTFAPGETAATIPITILGDTIVEPPFYFGEWGLISLSNPSANASVSTAGFFGLGIFVIVDDD